LTGVGGAAKSMPLASSFDIVSGSADTARASTD
jgi:hypothetical protein